MCAGLLQARYTVTLLLVAGTPWNDLSALLREHGDLARVIEAGIDEPEPKRAAHLAYLAMRDLRFDCAFLADSEPSGFYALCAKRAGLGFVRAPFVQVARTSAEWLRARGLATYRTADDLDRAYMTRRSLELADEVIVAGPAHERARRDAGVALRAVRHAAR
ncbi:MAG: hypothetical protein JWM87_3498, partial [Candidatus Eremiobacteraeota bacterium]|nr:hypothetical protein [Candidatus Eremiobacteraeota bacterium]